MRQEAAATKPFKQSRLTKVTSVNPDSKTVIVYPAEKDQAECMNEGVYLSGVQNNEKDGTGNRFNWGMSNGDTSQQNPGR